LGDVTGEPLTAVLILKIFDVLAVPNPMVASRYVVLSPEAHLAFKEDHTPRLSLSRRFGYLRERAFLLRTPKLAELGTGSSECVLETGWLSLNTIG